MKPEEITQKLQELFDSNVQVWPLDSWQVETDKFRLLVLLSEDRSWLRVLIPITPLSEAQPFLKQLMVTNFGNTQETCYALHENILWRVFQHGIEGLSVNEFSATIQRLITMGNRKLLDYFQQAIKIQIRQIIKASKMQGSF